jgi:hypothetical protein
MPRHPESIVAKDSDGSNRAIDVRTLALIVVPALEKAHQWRRKKRLLTIRLYDIFRIPLKHANLFFQCLRIGFAVVGITEGNNDFCYTGFF